MLSYALPTTLDTPGRRPPPFQHRHQLDKASLVPLYTHTALSDSSSVAVRVDSSFSSRSFSMLSSSKVLTNHSGKPTKGGQGSEYTNGHTDGKQVALCRLLRALAGRGGRATFEKSRVNNTCTHVECQTRSQCAHGRQSPGAYRRLTMDRVIRAPFSLSRPASRASSSLTVKRSARSECAFSSTI